MPRKNKGIGELWDSLNITRHRLEEEQKKTEQMESNFESKLDREIAKAVRGQFDSDGDLVQLLLDLQAGNVRIAIVPAESGIFPENDPGPMSDENDQFDEGEYGDE